MKDDTAFDWGVHTLPDERQLSLALGPLELEIRRTAGEIRIAHHRQGDRRSTGDSKWIRWVPASDWSGELALTPAFPDRPVVVRPDNEFWLTQGSEARIYVRLPLDVEIEALGPHRASLLRIPTRVLSDTWWGSTEEGVLHYYLDTKARRAMADAEFLEHLAVCPVQLRNASDEDLLVTRIALHTEYLTLYRDGTRLWSDETRVRYRGHDEESAVSVGGDPPPEARDAELVRPAQETMSRGFSARTFARIRSSLLGW